MNIDQSNRSINVKGNLSGAASTGNNSPVTVNHSTMKDENFVQTAKEIKALLEKLSQTYQTNDLIEQVTVAEKAIEQIEGNPTLKQRVVRALKAGTIETFVQIIDQPVVNIMRATLEGWRDNNY